MKGEAYEQAKRDVDDAWYEKFGRDKASSCERKPAFANAQDSDANENMAADSFVTCGECRYFTPTGYGVCHNVDSDWYEYQVEEDSDMDGYCCDYQPRTDSLEDVAKEMWGIVAMCAYPHSGACLDSCEYMDDKGNCVAGNVFKQRLRDCGVEI